MTNATNSGNSDWFHSVNKVQSKFQDFYNEYKNSEMDYKSVWNSIQIYKKQADMVGVTPGGKALKKKNFYEILGVKQNASKQQIKKIFKQLTLAYHPDRQESTGVDGDVRYREIKEAYETLMDDEKRKAHDQYLRIKGM